MLYPSFKIKGKVSRIIPFSIRVANSYLSLILLYHIKEFISIIHLAFQCFFAIFIYIFLYKGAIYFTLFPAANFVSIFLLHRLFILLLLTFSYKIGVPFHLQLYLVRCCELLDKLYSLKEFHCLRSACDYTFKYSLPL